MHNHLSPPPSPPPLATPSQLLLHARPPPAISSSLSLSSMQGQTLAHRHLPHLRHPSHRKPKSPPLHPRPTHRRHLLPRSTHRPPPPKNSKPQPPSPPPIHSGGLHLSHRHPHHRNPPPLFGQPQPSIPFESHSTFFPVSHHTHRVHPSCLATNQFGTLRAVLNPQATPLPESVIVSGPPKPPCQDTVPSPLHGHPLLRRGFPPMPCPCPCPWPCRARARAKTFNPARPRAVPTHCAC